MAHQSCDQKKRRNMLLKGSLIKNKTKGGGR